ncbi:aspartate--tRNA ligase, partial [Sarracenia purpurea var. burkii]
MVGTLKWFVLWRSCSDRQCGLDLLDWLDVYIHDYLLKRKLHNFAKAFMTEGKVATDPVGNISFLIPIILFAQEAGVQTDPLGDLNTEIERKLGLLVLEKYGTEFYILHRYPLAVRPFYTMPCFDDPAYSNSFDVFIRGVTGLPLKGWPLTGIDQLRPSLLQVQKPNLQTQNQFLLASQQQQVLAQAQAQGNIGNSPNFGFCGLPRGGIGAKD